MGNCSQLLERDGRPLLGLLWRIAAMLESKQKARALTLCRAKQYASASESWDPISSLRISD